MKKTLYIVLFLALSVPAHAGTKMGPFLRGIYDAVNGLSHTGTQFLLPLRTPPLHGSAGIMVDVLVKTTSPHAVKEFIADNHGSVGTSINGIMTARIPIPLAYDLAQRRDCVSIALSERTYPLLDKSVPAVGGDIVHQGGGGLPGPYTGRNVIVGIVDTGLDLGHADMHYPDGSTKVIALWNQTSTGTPPDGYSYGSVCTGYQINEGACGEQDTDGHGTHVTGIVDSSDATYTGMAPDAMLVIVKTDFSEAHIIDGVNFVFSVASLYGKPAVVNLSLGTQQGPHDDTSSFEQALDGLVTQAPGRAVVVAAGNDGENPIHLGFTAGPASQYASYFSVVTNSVNAGASYLDLWYDMLSPALSFAIGVISTSGTILTQTPFAGPGTTGPFTLLSKGGAVYGYAQVDASNTASGATSENEVALYVTNNGDTSIDLTQSQYGYRFVLLTQNGGASAQQLNAWIYTENSLFDTAAIHVPGYSTVQGDTSDTVASPSTARYAIAAGSFATKEWQPYFTDAPGTLSFFSSIGPTPAPTATGTKPDIAAPGEVIVSSLSSNAALPFPYDTMIAGDGTHVAIVGTSMASPHVAGAVALLFERDSGMTITDTIGLLESSATQDATTGTVPNSDWGYGKLDALALVRDAAQTPSDTTPPVISGVGVIAAQYTAQISWSTDELSSSYVKYWDASGPGSWVSTGTTTMTVAHTVGLVSLGPDTVYAYQVISTDPMGNMAVYPQNGQGLEFTTGSSTSFPSVPPAPTGLTAAGGNAEATLAWRPSAGATGYKVYQSMASGGPYTGTASTAGTGYTVTGLTNGTVYYFVVTAVNSHGESVYSNQASVTPAGPAAPTHGTSASRSAGCSCNQSGQGTAVWDLLPAVMLLLGWLAISYRLT